MKHVIICREYPPAPSGGIGTYVLHVANLLANSGETVHVIGQLCRGAEQSVEEKCNGRLIIHRVPLINWTTPEFRPSHCGQSEIARALLQTDFYPQSFSWQASLLTEKLIDQEGIDIIEAQEYEAPLYFLQIRRALNLGPRRNPPCVVHLHSPTEFVALHNDWNMGSPFVVLAKRLEAYSIGAADALLCPSLYLSRQAEAYFGLIHGCIETIPLPIGENPLVKRNKKTWEHGSICYTGRLERRKGVIEWIDAAVAVAHDYSSVHFEFIGANLLGGYEQKDGDEFINNRIPRSLKNRFHFHGHQDRADLPEFLANARLAVVPSRWENFPNTCVEAMCSGIPVIASPEGGMAEMIRDGQTGWIAPNAESSGLELALRRALETPSVRLAQMGHQAATDIRKMCDNASILERHLRFRHRVVQQGSKRSLHLPVNLARGVRKADDERPPRSTTVNSKRGLALIVNCQDGEELLDVCLQCIQQQTNSPTSVVLMVDNSKIRKVQGAIQRARTSGWHVCERKGKLLATQINDGIARSLSTGANPAGFVFLTPYDRIKPNYIETCESVLLHCPSVGLVSSWTQHIGSNHKFTANPCPDFPYQILYDETSPTTTIRTEALQEVGLFRNEMSPRYEHWDCANAVMAAGWTAITVPMVLAERIVTEQICTATHPIYSLQRKELLSRISEVVAHNACELILLLESRMSHPPHPPWSEPSSRDILRMSLAMQLGLGRKAVRMPLHALNFVAWHTKSAIEEGIRRLRAHIAHNKK